MFLRPDSLKTSHTCSSILLVSSVKMKLIWDSETWESCVEDGRVSVSLSPHKTVHPPGQLCQAARNELFWSKIHNAFLVSATAGYTTLLFLTIRNSNSSASPTRWTWVWVDSGSWWWTGRPGVLRFMGSHRVGRLSDWTELNGSACVKELDVSQCLSRSVSAQIVFHCGPLIKQPLTSCLPHVYVHG